MEDKKEIKTEELEVCMNCKYFIPRLMECHRFPSEVKIYTVFHWCGEFKTRRRKYGITSSANRK